MADYFDTVSKIGEDAVYEYLKRYSGHNVRRIEYSTQTDKDLQDHGCDILEAWSGGEIWHEVKTERWTLNSKVNRAKDFWNYIRQAVDVEDEKGTGNVFIEFVQNIPKRLLKRKEKEWEWAYQFDIFDYSVWPTELKQGWYPKYKEWDENHLPNYDERYIWFVFRVNPDKIIDQGTAEHLRLEKSDKPGHLINFMCWSEDYTWKQGGGCIAVKATMEKLYDVVEKEKKRCIGKFSENKKTGAISWGILLPVLKVWCPTGKDAMWIDDDKTIAMAKVPSADNSRANFSESWFYNLMAAIGGDIGEIPKV